MKKTRTNLKKMYLFIKQGKTFEEFLSEFYKDLNLKCENNIVYEDQVFISLLKEMNVNLSCPTDDKRNYLILDDYYLLSTKVSRLCDFSKKRFGEHIAIDFSETDLWEDIMFKDILEDHFLGEILDHINLENYRSMRHVTDSNRYLSYNEQNGDIYEESLMDLVEYSIDVLKDLLIDEDSIKDYPLENSYLSYLNKIKDIIAEN